MHFRLAAGLLSLPLLVSAPVAAQSFRADIHAGVDRVSADNEAQTGATYGLSLNYDLTKKDVIIGAQIDLDATDNRACENGVIVVGDKACIEGKRDNALSLRLGHKVGSSAELYALLGYANAQFRATYVGAGTRASDRESLDGVRAGVGAILSVGRKLYVKAEYRHTNYEDGVSRNQGLIGLGLRF